jgi:tripartite-type tricarboxylate transporter receptor subunit TctC
MDMRLLSGPLPAVAATPLTFATADAQTGPAQNYPTKPIRIIVGFTAGGGNDILARLVGQKLSESLHQPVIVENKPGAGAMIATEYVAKAAPDGHTLLMGASGAMTVNPAVYTKISYDTLRDFRPIVMIASFPLFLVVNPSLPLASVSELVAYAKANPQKSNYAASSAAFQLATELFKLKTGAPMEYIAYKGSNDSVMAVIAGEVLLTIADATPVSGQLQAGQVRALAVTSHTRNTEFPDVPTMAEAGIPDMNVELWSGFFAPAGTPDGIVAKLQDEVGRIVHLPEIRERMKALAVDPAGKGSDEFARVIASDISRWAAVAQASHVKIER